MARTGLMLAVFASAATLGACAGPVARTGPDLALPQAETDNLAALLTLADRAQAQGDRETLGLALRRLAARGARPLDVAGERVMAGWRKDAGATTPPLRGRALGPGFRTGALSAGKQARIEQTFLSGQRATIEVAANEGSELALAVTRADNSPVCEERSRRSECSWVPMYTERHQIVVRNPGKRAVRFYIVIE